jgi:hypothetical protein
MQDSRTIVVDIEDAKKNDPSEPQKFRLLAMDIGSNHLYMSEFCSEEDESFATELERLVGWLKATNPNEEDSLLHHEFISFNNRIMDRIMEDQKLSRFYTEIFNFTDFFSYFAGVKGITRRQAEYSLMPYHFLLKGAERIRRLGYLFKAVRSQSESINKLIDACAELKRVIGSNPFVENLFEDWPKPGEE